jgi:hypothetical protein
LSSEKLYAALPTRLNLGSSVADVERSMWPIFDDRMMTNQLVQRRGLGAKACDAIANFTLGFSMVRDIFRPRHAPAL